MASTEQLKKPEHEKFREGEYRYYSDDPTDLGFLIRKGNAPAEIQVERSGRNYHLFIFNHQASRFELNDKGSALIVGFLETQKTAIEQGAPNRPLAFFDTSGNFFDGVLLTDLLPNEEKAGQPNEVRHSATFEVGSLELPVKIDDICVLGLAVPLEDPVVMS